jgi:hypothetical protein
MLLTPEKTNRTHLSFFLFIAKIYLHYRSDEKRFNLRGLFEKFVEWRQFAVVMQRDA